MLMYTDPRHLLSDLFRYLELHIPQSLWNLDKILDNSFTSIFHSMQS